MAANQNKPADLHIATLLRLVRTKQSVSQLKKRGFQHSQILMLLAECEDRGYLAFGGDDLPKVTAEGAKFLHAGVKRLGGASGWIEPQLSSKIEPDDPSMVYIPPHRVLRKLGKKR